MNSSQILDLTSENLGHTLTVLRASLSHEQFRAAKKMICDHHYHTFRPRLKELLGERACDDPKQLSLTFDSEEITYEEGQ